MTTTIRFPLPPTVLQRWRAMRAAIDMAAQPYTGSDWLPLPVSYLHNVIGADQAMSAAMAGVRPSVPDAPISGHFVLSGDTPMIELSW